MFRILLSETHEEIVNSSNTDNLQTLLGEMETILFPLIEAPITYENIKDDDLLILGCPQTKFSIAEMDDIEKFVSDGKILLLISGNLGDSFYNTNLSDLARRFDLEFNENQVENVNDNHGSPSSVYINDFPGIFLSNTVRNLVYSGCTINLLDDSCTVIARTTQDSSPPKSPVIVTSKNKKVILFGGFNLFIDHDDIGIHSENNFEFLLNFFDHIFRTLEYIREQGKSEAEDIKDEEKFLSETVVEKKSFEFDTGFCTLEDDHDLKILGIINGELSKVTPKKAEEKFVAIINMFIEYLEKLEDIIDKFWNHVKDLIKQDDENKIEKLNALLNEKYNEFNQEINRVSGKVNDQHVEFCSFFDEKHFDQESSLTNWFESEAALRQHLDIIRNNLLALLNS